MSLEKFDGILRKRLSEEKAETKDDLVNLSVGVLQKFKTVVNEVSVANYYGTMKKKLVNYFT